MGVSTVIQLATAHLMAAHGFSAREAIGWLRVVRPGSVVGAQQHYLCLLGDALQRRGAWVRDSALSLEPSEENQFSAKDRMALHRCTSSPLEGSGWRSRIRLQSEICEGTHYSLGSGVLPQPCSGIMVTRPGPACH